MIPESVRRELRDLEITTTRAMRNARVGAYTSRTRGSGFDFDQHAPYRPGDDVRLIDWNVTARLHAPYLRQTHAERELDLVVAVDVSRSMAVATGRRSKREALMLVTASVLFSAGRDQINAGLVAFADDVLSMSPPRRVGGRAWQLLEELWALAPRAARRPGRRASSSTRLLPVVHQLNRSLRTTTMIVVVSDFWLDDAAFDSAALRMLAARHDVIAVVLDDPPELALPAGRGIVRARDVETGRELTVPLTAATRRAHAAAIAARRRRLVDQCYRLGIDYAFLRTDRPVVEPLIELFARRQVPRA